MAALGAAVPPPAVVLPMEGAAAAGVAPAAAAPPASTKDQLAEASSQVGEGALASGMRAAAALSLFAMSTADTPRVQGACDCEPTDAEAAALCAASERMLLAAVAQVLGAITAVLVPARPVAVFATLLGRQTGYRAPRVLRMLIPCHARVDVVLAVYYCVFVVAMWVAYVVSAVISVARTLATYFTK